MRKGALERLKGQKTSVKGDSELCLACGICCRGVLHTYAVIQPDEIDQVLGLGLEPMMRGDRNGFLLPCPLFTGNCCPVYANRLSPCRGYRCALLKKYGKNDITLDQALLIVKITKELLSDVIEHLPHGYSFSHLQKAIHGIKDTEQNLLGSDALLQDNKIFFLKLGTLIVSLKENFVSSEEKAKS